MSGTADLHELEPGSQYWPGGQLRGCGCAEPVADIATERAAIGAQAAATIAERMMFFRISSACPDHGISNQIIAWQMRNSVRT